MNASGMMIYITVDPVLACLWIFGCSVQGEYLTHSADYTIDTAFYDLCLDMIAAIGEPYGASATVRHDAF